MTSYSTATEILAAAVRARKVSSAVLARDLGIPHAPLHNFAHCNGMLPPQVLRALANYLFGGAVTIDVERNLLCSTNETPPQTMEAYPPLYAPKTKVPMQGGLNLGKPKPAQKREGWA